ncbi:MAG: EAL domain-containing protein [Pseudomonadota bacterium]
MNQLRKIIFTIMSFATLFGLLLFANWSVREGAVEQLRIDTRAASVGLMNHIEGTLGSSLQALITIASSNTPACSPQQLALMRRTVYEVDPIKELGVSGGDGSGICNHIGDDLRVRRLSEPVQSSNRNVLLQVVEVRGSGKPAMMVSWVVNASERYVAIVPTSALLSGSLATASQEIAKQISLADGTSVASHLWLDQLMAAPDHVSSTTQSQNFPLIVRLAAPKSLAFGRLLSIMQVVNIAGAAVLAVIGLVVYRLSKMPEQPLTEIERGIKREEFEPFYQPVIDISTGLMMGCEVLTRWRKADGSVVPPGAFIALAEASGLAVPMTRSVMQKVAQDLSDVRQHPSSLKIGINLFDAHFENTDIVDDIQAIFGDCDIRMSQLMFEITERQPLSNVARAQIVIKKIQSSGAKVALDDAGTGHGGLAYLQQFGMDAIKIDKMFIDRITPDVESAPIVDSMINMAKDLKMEVIAEGIEDAVQMEYLRQRGVKAAQGYLFAPPLPKKEYLALCARLGAVSSVENGEQTSAMKTSGLESAA